MVKKKDVDEEAEEDEYLEKMSLRKGDRIEVIDERDQKTIVDDAGIFKIERIYIEPKEIDSKRAGYFVYCTKGYKIIVRREDDQF